MEEASRQAGSDVSKAFYEQALPSLVQENSNRGNPDEITSPEKAQWAKEDTSSDSDDIHEMPTTILDRNSDLMAIIQQVRREAQSRSERTNEQSPAPPIPSANVPPPPLDHSDAPQHIGSVTAPPADPPPPPPAPVKSQEPSVSSVMVIEPSLERMRFPPPLSL